MRLTPIVTAILATALAGPVLADSSTSRTLSAEEIDEVTSAELKDIRACYQHHVSVEASGQVALGLLIDRFGLVADLDIEAPGVEDEAFYSCVRDDVNEWRFPQADLPTLARVPYYFLDLDVKGAGPTR